MKVHIGTAERSRSTWRSLIQQSRVDKLASISAINDRYNCRKPQMYRKHHKWHLSIEEFHVPFGCTLDPENRWVLFFSLMPWEELVATHAPQTPERCAAARAVPHQESAPLFAALLPSFSEPIPLTATPLESAGSAARSRFFAADHTMAEMGLPSPLSMMELPPVADAGILITHM